MAAILKIEISPYFSNSLTDYREIWHGDAHCPLPRPCRQL